MACLARTIDNKADGALGLAASSVVLVYTECSSGGWGQGGGGRPVEVLDDSTIGEKGLRVKRLREGRLRSIERMGDQRHKFPSKVVWRK